MSMSNSESRKREADKAAVPSGLASELRERIMDYGNHLTAVQAMDAARAILASDWLAEHVAAAKAEGAAAEQRRIWDLMPETVARGLAAERELRERIEALLPSNRFVGLHEAVEVIKRVRAALAADNRPAPECADCHRSPDEHEPNDHPHVPVGDQAEGEQSCGCVVKQVVDFNGCKSGHFEDVAW